MIYFIKSVISGAIKIGYTGNEPSRRLATLQTGSAEPLELLGSIPGGIADERAMHTRFASCRVRADGEWFAPDAAMREAIRQILSPKPPELPVFRFRGVAVRNVYLAGKITGTNWRDEIVPGWSGTNRESDNCGETYGLDEWPGKECYCDAPGYQPIRLSGPFWEQVYGGPHGGPPLGTHALTIADIDHWTGRKSTSHLKETECCNVAAAVRDAVSRSDLVLAWLDSLDCFGSILEIGFAAGLGKPVVVASPDSFDASELWLSLATACLCMKSSGPGETWDRLLNGEGRILD